MEMVDLILEEKGEVIKGVVAVALITFVILGFFNWVVR